GYYKSGTTQTGTAGVASVTTTCSACTAASNGSHSTVTLTTNSSNQCVYTGTCATGYSTSGGTNTGTTCSGNGCSCSAKCNAITLSKGTNGGTAGTITVYALSDDTKLYTNNACTTAATSSTVTAGSKTNATFGGYYNTTAASGGTQCVTTGGTSLASGCTVKAAATYNAQYDCTTNYRGSGTRIAGTCTGNGYTITYAAGTGGSGANQTQSVTYGSSFTTKASNTFTKANATFAGWSPSSGSYTSANTSYTYSTAGNVTLTATWNCNAGYTLNSSTNACDACAKGTYKTSAGNGACTAASGRTQYTDTTAATSVKTVSSGYYTTGCNSSNNNCTGQTQCTGTTYCESGVQKDCPNATTYKRTTFPANYYNPVLKSTAVQSANGRSAITQCTALSWYNPGDRAGLYEYVTYNSSTSKYDTTTAWQYMSVKAGYYLTSKGSCGAYAYYTEVKECPAGSYCPGKSEVSCNASNQATVHTTNFGLETCPANYASSAAGAKAATSCYLTTSSTKFVATANAAQTPCTAGGYCPGSVTVYYGSTGGRTACAAGKYNASTGSSAASACVACAIGSYSGAGASSCTACQSGKTTSATGQSSCNANCSNAANVGAWKTATWAANSVTNLCTIDSSSSSACTAAVKGTGAASATYTVTNNTCVYSGTCSAKYYKPVASGATVSCTGCPTAYPNSTAGNTYTSDASCYLTLTAGQQVASAGAGASACSKGYYCTSTGNIFKGTGTTTYTGTACQNGSYQDETGKTVCKPCAAGKTNTGTGNTAACTAACTAITGLSTWATTSWSNGTVSNLCTLGTCSANYYKNGTACSTCSAGTSSKYTLSAAGSTSVGQCYLTLTAGKQVASAGAGVSNCAAGKYCTSTSNIYYNSTGGTTTYTGTNCAAGHYSTGGASACTACQNGSYQDGTGASSCKPCAAGKTNTGTGNTAACTAACTAITGLSTWATTSWSNGTVSNLCTLGTCSANYYKNGTACSTCSAGTSSKYTLSAAGSTSVGQCYLTLTAGKQVASAGAGVSNCAAGKYCTSTSNIYYNSTGGTTTYTGTNCAAGHYSTGGASACTACQNGSYQDGTGASSCKPCAAGKTNTGTGNTAACTAACTAITGLSTWATTSWSNGTVSNLCTVSTCAANYYKSGNTCPTCSSGTNSKYTLSAAGTTSVNSCYLT
ncbi:MAG: InlB B-repeat-containing protein, partial [Alphaproteobacteria bacterium]|nr:InlB B-repeat-containing protein [Alphaproteobacteria bacterium]